MVDFSSVVVVHVVDLIMLLLLLMPLSLWTLLSLLRFPALPMLSKNKDSNHRSRQVHLRSMTARLEFLLRLRSKSLGMLSAPLLLRLRDRSADSLLLSFFSATSDCSTCHIWMYTFWFFFTSSQCSRPRGKERREKSMKEHSWSTVLYSPRIFLLTCGAIKPCYLHPLKFYQLNVTPLQMVSNEI